jgi:hypothetical protein
MSNLIDALQAVGALSTGVGLGVGVYQYYQAERFKRMQKLFDLFETFRTNERFVNLFSAFENLSDNPTSTESSLTIAGGNDEDKIVKYQFLALLEEVALFAESELIKSDDAIYMFHFHFFYVFGPCKQSKLFWEDIGGENEPKKPGWARSYAFAKRCFEALPAELKAKVALK